MKYEPEINSTFRYVMKHGSIDKRKGFSDTHT